MSNGAMRPLRILWEGPLSVDAACGLQGDDDAGLYQIYGRHIVFGAGALLYVGRAIGQTFGARLSQHAATWLSYEQEVSVRVGRLHPDDLDEEPAPWPGWAQLVRDAEAFTIWWHSPPYNSTNVGSCKLVAPRHVASGIWLQHHGARGALQAEQTSVWGAAKARPPEEDD